MRKIRRSGFSFYIIISILLLSCLTACGKKKSEEKPEVEEKMEISDPTPVPTPVPTPTPEPTPEPVSVFEPGNPVCVNGEPIESFSYQGICYVLFDHYVNSCCFSYRYEDDCANFTFRKDEYRIDLPSVQMYKNTSPVALAPAPIYEFGLLYVPVSAFSALIGVSEYVDVEFSNFYYTPSAGAFEINAAKNVPVLMYHGITDKTWGSAELFVSPSSFDEQLTYLEENGYQTIFFEDLWNIDAYDKPVILTFDDGYSDNYEFMFPILKQHNMKATIFVITGWMGDQSGTYLNYEQAREMSDSGLVSIQSHTMSHQELSKIPEEIIHSEMALSKVMITRITGKEPCVLCYPVGYYNDSVLNIIPTYYNFGILMGGGMWNTSQSNYLVGRQYISRYTDINNFAAYLVK